MTNKISIVYATFSNMEEARRISTEIIRMCLAGCINLIPNVTAIYPSDGQINESEEICAIIKTKSKFVEYIIQEIEKTHSYKIPCIIEVPTIKANYSYISWINNILLDDK